MSTVLNGYTEHPLHIVCIGVPHLGGRPYVVVRDSDGVETTAHAGDTLNIRHAISLEVNAK